MNTTKKRSDNWTAEDKMLLQELVKERVDVIENKNTDTNTNSRKVAAGADLLQSFNIMRNGANRTVAQLKNQWGTLKSAEKRKVSAEKKARFETGGGPPPLEDPTDSNAIRAWLPQEFETDTNEFDSDSISQILIADTCAATATATGVEVIIEQEPVVQETTPPALEASPIPHTLPTREVPASQRVPSTGQSSLRTKKRKISQPAGQLAADIAANEIKCRTELHKIQIENEERRKENEVRRKRILELKEQLLLTKIKYFKSKMN